MRQSTPVNTIYLLLFASGFSALIYETSWVRLLGLVLGNTTQAASIVLAVFLGGLALGALVGGKLADRSVLAPLRLYAVLELSIAVLGPLVSACLQIAPQLFAGLYRAFPPGSTWLILERIGISALLLLPPTFVMGATLPAISKYINDRGTPVPNFFSVLYGMNTLGSVAGTLAACFITFPFLGVFETVLVAAAINGFIALTALILATRPSYQTNSQQVPAPVSEAPQQEAQPADSKPIVPVRFLYGISALMGFAALSFEVLWMRLIRPFTNSSTYAFSFMVSAFLLGLVLGSFWYDRKLRANPALKDNSLEQLGMLSRIQQWLAIFSCIGFLILPLLYVVDELFRVSTHQVVFDTAACLLWDGFLSALVMILPCTLIGVGFPALCALASEHKTEVGETIGSVYASNTFGCIAGSLVCGLIMIPLFGSQLTFAFVVALVVLSSVILGWYDKRDSAKQKTARILMQVAVLAAFCLIPQGYAQHAFASLTGGKVLAHKEDGADIFVGAYSPNVKRLVINGIYYSSDALGAQRYMRMLGHLPVLLNKHNHLRALIVCFGCGTTAGSIAKQPEVDHVDIVDVSPVVYGFSNYFSGSNDNVLSNPKCSHYLEDGRNFLLRSADKYDVISFEPPPPCDAGIASLYSKEFYELCKAHLNPGGVLCQWLPINMQAAPLSKMIAKTILEVFPYADLWLPNNSQGIVACSNEPMTFNVDRVSAAIKEPAVKRSLDSVGLGSVEALLSTYLLSRDSLSQFAGTVPCVTDDHAYLEFFMPYAGVRALPTELEPLQSDVHRILVLGHVPLDEQKLKTYMQCMHYNRVAESIIRTSTLGEGQKQVVAPLSAAVDLMPADPYFLWVKENKNLLY